MASISTTINLADRMSGPMQKMISAVDTMITAMDKANTASENMFDTNAIFEARSDMGQAKAMVDELSASLQKADANADNLSTSMRGVGEGSTSDPSSGISKLASGAGGFVKGLMGFTAVQKGLDMVTSSIGGAVSRMDTMANYQKTMTAITGSSDAAAASVNKMSDALAKAPFTLDATAQAVQNFVTRGMSINKATKQVLDWGDAVSFYGDGTNETFLNVTDALGKMMSKGKVEMDQLDRLTDAGINAVGIYAQATGRNTASVQEDLSKGNISAQDFISTVTNAFETGKNGVLNISGAMDNMEGTWSVAFTNMSAAIARGWADILQAINDGMSNAGLGSMQSILENIGYGIEDAMKAASSAIQGLFHVLQPVMNFMSSVGSAIQRHWLAIKVAVGIAAGAVGTYIAAVKLLNIYRAISNGLEKAGDWLTAIAVANMKLKAGATLEEAAATKWAKDETIGLNGALLASPWLWVIACIVAVIAVVIILANHFSGVGHVAQTVFGAICGYINVVIAFFVNLVKTVVAVAAAIFGAIDACAQNSYIAFQNAIGKVEACFYNLRATALSVIADIANSLNKLPFVKIDVAGLRSAASDFKAKAEKADTKKEYISVAKYAKGRYMAYGGNAFKTNWYGAAYARGATWGDQKWKSVTGKIGNVSQSIAKATKGVKQQISKAAPSTGTKGTKGSKAKQKKDKKNNTTDKAVKSAASDLSLLRKLAEKQAMGKVIHRTVKLDMKGMKNYFKKDEDIDGFVGVVVNQIAAGLDELSRTSAEGSGMN